jgi:ribosomal protein S27AE
MTKLKRADATCSNCGAAPVVARGYCDKCYRRWRKHGDPTITLVDRSRPPGSPCSECDEPVVARGYCRKHWRAWREYGDPNFVARPPRAGASCSNCGDPLGRHGARGLCGKCYTRWQRHGDASDSVLTRHPRKGSACINCGDPVSRSSALGYCARCYQRWQKHGDPNVVLPPSLPPVTRKYTLNHEYFNDIRTPEQAYWLGFITADGGVIRDSKSFTLRLELAKKDAEHVRLFAQALGSDTPVRPSRGSVYVPLNSRQLVESLERLGIGPRKSATVEPWDGPGDLMPHYWRGLFDGDGCIGRHSKQRPNSWNMTQLGSRACVVSFTEWAKSICGTKATPVHLVGGCWSVAIGGSYTPQRLAVALFGAATVALPRKLALAKDLIESDFRALNNGRGRPRY